MCVLCLMCVWCMNRSVWECIPLPIHENASPDVNCHFETGSLTELEAPCFGQAGWPESSGNLPVSTYQCDAWLLILMLVIRTQVLMFAEQGLLAAEPPPQPLYSHFIKCGLLWESVQLPYNRLSLAFLFTVAAVICRFRCGVLRVAWWLLLLQHYEWAQDDVLHGAKQPILW